MIALETGPNFCKRTDPFDRRRCNGAQNKRYVMIKRCFSKYLWCIWPHQSLQADRRYSKRCIINMAENFCLEIRICIVLEIIRISKQKFSAMFMMHLLE